MDDRKLRQKGTVDCNKGRVGFDDGEVTCVPGVYRDRTTLNKILICAALFGTNCLRVIEKVVVLLDADGLVVAFSNIMAAYIQTGAGLAKQATVFIALVTHDERADTVLEENALHKEVSDGQGFLTAAWLQNHKLSHATHDVKKEFETISAGDITQGPNVNANDGE